MAAAHTQSEENYLKAIYMLSAKSEKGASTTALSKSLQTKASSVTDMLKKLAAKELINYKKYQGVSLTEAGRIAALRIIRKHRLWEVFLVEKLHYSWDKIHDLAEELEHIGSVDFVDRLDRFLDFPRFDPHGDPIPDAHGKIQHHQNFCVTDLMVGQSGTVVGVKDSSAAFLQYLEKLGLVPGCTIELHEVIEFDGSLNISINNREERMISSQAGENLYVKPQGTEERDVES